MENNSIFTNTPNWSFSQNDSKAEQKFNHILLSHKSALPEDFFTGKTLAYSDMARQTKLYQLLKTIPKGVLHHLHFDCAQDIQFYRQHISNNPIVYFNQKIKNFEIGTKKQAQQGNWIPMNILKSKYQSEDEFCKFLVNLTTLNTQQMGNYTASSDAWPIFQQRILRFLTILGVLSIFKNYFKHICLKHIKNGYERLEFRFLLTKLKQYDQQGNLVKQHDQSIFAKACDQVMEQINKNHPNFTVGFIAFGLKVFSPEVNQELLTKACSLGWKRLIGIDFVQQQDPYGSLQPYDLVADKVLAKFPNSNIKKVYHCGETKKQTNNNIEIAVRAGSVRVGHGVNILQKAYLQQIIQKKVCFEVSLVSNLFTHLCHDPRKCHAVTLLNLGVPVSLNSDDPGKFNNEDSTFDYWLAMVSFDWSLKHLKLIAIHSINHSICSQNEKKKMMKNFNSNWDKWIQQYLHLDH